VGRNHEGGPCAALGSEAPKRTLGCVGEDSGRDVDGEADLWTTLWKVPGETGRATRDASSDTLACHPRSLHPSGRRKRSWYRAVGALVTPSRTRPRLVKANEPDRPTVQCSSVFFSTTEDGR
jgi:hypothetical protein